MLPLHLQVAVDDKEVVLGRVQQDGASLQFASPRMRDDKEVVVAAVEEGAKSLIYASHRLKDDKEVVLAAVQQDGALIFLTKKKLPFT